MKAMILAAGLGTRLRPLTDDRPKALVEVAGRTLLDLTLARLRTFGIFEVMINTHHHAGMIADYLHAHRNFGMQIALSPEPILLNTGGGLKNAAAFFFAPGPDAFLVHNVDVLSTIDIAQMLHEHTATGALATLAVQPRATSRQLLFDSAGQLCGRQISGETHLVRPATDPQSQAFSGIHILSTRIFQKLTEQGPFSIIDAYLRLAAAGESILAFDARDAYWCDLGRPESIDQADHDIATGRYSAPRSALS
jgi:NDP-sugar pyrophosphorylase family protein